MAEIKTQIINAQVPIDPLLHDVLSGPAGEFYRNALINRNIASVNPTNAFKDDDDIIMGSRDDDREKTDKELASIALGDGGGDFSFKGLEHDQVLSKKGGGRRRKRKSRRKKKTRRKRRRKRRKRKIRRRRRR